MINIFKKFGIVLTAICIAVFMSTCFTGCVDYSNKNPVVTITIDPDNKNLDENGEPLSGTFQIELFPEKAPNSVAYFLDFVANGTYDGFPVSKVMHGGVVQFGDPWLMKQIRTEIKGEFKENGFDANDIEFKRGTVALDRFVASDYDSASGDFFILLSDEGADTYQGKYAAIGEVVSGIDVLEKVSLVKNYIDYSPLYSIKTKTSTVDLKGATYDKPVTDERRTYPGTNTD